MGLIQALDDGVLERSIQSGHVDLLLVGVIAGPEEVSGHPVHCQAVSVREVWWSDTPTRKILTSFTDS